MKISGINSFGTLRLILATMVLIKHASDITGLKFAGNMGRIDLGTIAVFGFFSISGYLITPGLLRGGVKSYLTRRFFRIYPAYLVTVLSLGLIFCPLWSFLEDKKILFSFKYILTNFVFLPQSASSPHSYMNHLLGLPHLTHSPGIPDAPFWSLSLESACYLALVGIFLINIPGRRLTYASKLTIVGIFFLPIAIFTSQKITNFFLKNPTEMQNLFAKWPFILCFLAGSLISIIPKEKWNHLAYLPLLGLFIWLGSYSTFRFAVFGGLSITLFTLILGESKIFAWVPLQKDISYGIYLYHFPVEQTLAHVQLLRGSPFLFTALSASFASIPAYLSAKFIEEPIQNRVKKFTNGS